MSAAMRSVCQVHIVTLEYVVHPSDGNTMTSLQTSHRWIPSGPHETDHCFVVVEDHELQCFRLEAALQQSERRHAHRSHCDVGCDDFCLGSEMTRATLSVAWNCRTKETLCSDLAGSDNHRRLIVPSQRRLHTKAMNISSTESPTQPTILQRLV